MICVITENSFNTASSAVLIDCKLQKASFFFCEWKYIYLAYGWNTYHAQLYCYKIENYSSKAIQHKNVWLLLL